MMRPVLAALLWVFTVPAPDQSSIASRLVKDDIKIGSPIWPCEVAFVAARIARSVRVPAGVESVPESCQLPSSRRAESREARSLLGMTVSDALNTIVQVDPRYLWAESDGVLIVRPLVAWNDRKHRRFSVDLGATSVLEALNAIVRAHGELVWEITYCRPQALYEHATIWLSTFDASRMGAHVAVLRSPDGKTYDPYASDKAK